MKKNPDQSLSKGSQARKDAVEYLKKAMDFGVGDAERHFYIGMACMTLVCCEEAVAAFKMALSIDPNHAFAFEKMRFACVSIGLYGEEVIETCTEIIRRNPQHAAAHTFLGECYHKVGERDRAIPFLEEAIAIDPVAPAPHLILGQVHAELGNKDSAMEEYRKLARLDKNRAETLLNFIASRSYLKSNRISTAF